MPWSSMSTRQDHLESDQTLQAGLPCLVHHTHAATAQLGQQFVVTYIAHDPQ